LKSSFSDSRYSRFIAPTAASTTSALAAASAAKTTGAAETWAQLVSINLTVAIFVKCSQCFLGILYFRSRDYPILVFIQSGHNRNNHSARTSSSTSRRLRLQSERHGKHHSNCCESDYLFHKKLRKRDACVSEKVTG